jgi:hypothetical protein
MVQSGLIKVIEETWGDPGLFARADVFDVTTGAFVFSGHVVMNEIVPGSYAGVMTPQAGRSYYVAKRVYTDDTFAAVDPGYSQASEEFQAVNLAFAGAEAGGLSMIGVIEQMSELQGSIEGVPEVLGAIVGTPEIRGSIENLPELVGVLEECSA